MGEVKEELDELRRRLERLEARIDFLFRSLGVSTQDAPGWKASLTVIRLVADGRKKEAIRAFREETGASLKDAKRFVDSISS